MKNETRSAEANVVSSEKLLLHWQEHRRLTRKVLLAFPEDKFFTYSVGGMRPMAELAMEIIGMSIPGVYGLATGQWEVPDRPEVNFSMKPPATRAEVLKLWDETTEVINKVWPQITAERFNQTDKAFGMYEGPVHWHQFYFVDNEIHHRAQAYVYLRSLGIEPPAFWDRF